MSKIIVIITFIVVGILLTIVRLLRNQQQQNTVSKLIKSIKENPETINKILSELTSVYYTKTIDESFRISELLTTLYKVQVVGTSKVEFIHNINENEVLLITTCTDNDYDIGIDGRHGDAKKVFNINYLLKYKPDTQDLILYSNLQRDNYQKNLRLTFADKLLSKSSANN